MATNECVEVALTDSAGTLIVVNTSSYVVNFTMQF